MAESKRIPEIRVNTSPKPETCGKASVAECKPNDKLSLTAVIRRLAIGDTVRFPIEKHGSVKAVVSRMKIERMRVGWNARLSVDSDNYQVVVRRIK